jgi:hypothetical protein
MVMSSKCGTRGGGLALCCQVKRCHELLDKRVTGRWFWQLMDRLLIYFGGYRRVAQLESVVISPISL